MHMFNPPHLSESPPSFSQCGIASAGFLEPTMQVNEEVSALKTMGINPIAYLVFPKLLALFIAMPLLTIFGDVAGLLGGLTVSYLYLDIPISVYCSRTIAVLDNTTLSDFTLYSGRFGIFND